MTDRRYYPSLIAVWFAAWLVIYLVTRSWIAAPGASGVMLAVAWLLTYGGFGKRLNRRGRKA